MRTPHVGVVSLALLALALTACGSGEEEGTSAVAAGATAATAGPTPSSSETPSETPSKAASPSETAVPSASSSETPEPALSPDNIVPSVDVVDVRTGATVDVQSVVPSETPVLLWAWAPHCPACRAEAPAAEAFASEHRDIVTMVGLGTQDDLAYAERFLRDTGVSTPRMLWDPSFESWAQLGISAQPTWILVDGGGAAVQAWVGALPEDEVLAALRTI